MSAVALKLAPMGNSKWIQLPAALITKYHLDDGIVLEESNGCLVLRPTEKAAKKLGWEETGKQMAVAKEDWSDWEEQGAAGLGSGITFQVSKPLLTEVDKGFSEPWWANYRALVERREQGSIAADELRELMALTDTLEEYNTSRMACFQAVSEVLGIGVDRLMTEADLKPRTL